MKVKNKVHPKSYAKQFWPIRRILGVASGMDGVYIVVKIQKKGFGNSRLEKWDALYAEKKGLKKYDPAKDGINQYAPFAEKPMKKQRKNL